SGVEPYVNGQAWGKGQNAGDRDTQGLVEFRDGDGNVLWWFNLPRSWDSEGNEQLGTFQFKKQGNSLFVTHRVPLSYVQDAVYPLMVDVTVNDQIAADTDDMYEIESSGNVWDGSGMALKDNTTTSRNWGGFRWDSPTGSWPANGDTIDVAYQESYFYDNPGDDIHHHIYAEDAAGPGTFTAGSGSYDITGRTPTTAKVDWDAIGVAPSGAWVQSPSLVSVFQELVDDYTITAVVLVWKSGLKDDTHVSDREWTRIREHDTSSTFAAKLHIEYTLSPNATPTITSVTDTPDPVNSGSNITFSVDWNDADAGDLEKAHICKTDAITGQTCDGGSWADSTSFTTDDPINLTYTAQDADAGSNNYYAFVCDDDNACSSSTSGTFTVNRLPNTPSSLGPTSLVDGSWGADNTPSLTFNLSDPDTNDQVRFQIQIDDDSDFSSLLVDYTSSFATEGTSRTFTVGQAASSGSYTTGSEGQTLSDGSYYWQVRAEDDDNAQSSYTQANSGAIAFRVDTTSPTNVSISSITADSTTQLTVTADIAADSGAGLHSTPYFFQETSGNSGGSSSSAYQISTSFVDTGLTANTQYTYRVKAKDAVNNESSYSSTSSAYTSAPTPTNFSGTAALSTISLSVDSFTNNTAGSSGYYFYRSGGSPNSGWIQTNSWQDTGLSCGTSYAWYVKYRNGDGTETATTSLTKSTNGCGGAGVIGPPVSTTGQGNIFQDLGGEVRRTFESGQITKVVFPPQSIKGTVVVKIEPKDKTEIIKTNPLPKNTQIIGDLVADFKALSGGKELESFEKLVSITFTYTDSQVKEAKVDEKTLKIFFWDKKVSSWKVLKSEVNILTNAVTAYTSHFSLFAVMGETKEKPISEMTIEELKVKIVEISAKIAQLKAQIAQLLEKEVTEEIPANYRFIINLEYDQTNDDVRYLQIFLKAQGQEIYPEGIVSGWFGPLTKKAVIRFQEKYALDILSHWGLTKGTGYVGPKTRVKMNEILGR
ncbi:hypothetical protein LCGC14_0256240, partial [marine sediment metagenome]